MPRARERAIVGLKVVGVEEVADAAACLIAVPFALSPVAWDRKNEGGSAAPRRRHHDPTFALAEVGILDHSKPSPSRKKTRPSS